MLKLQLSSRVTGAIVFLMFAVGSVCLPGCGDPDPAADPAGENSSTNVEKTPTPEGQAVAPAKTATDEITELPDSADSEPATQSLDRPVIEPEVARSEPDVVLQPAETEASTAVDAVVSESVAGPDTVASAERTDRMETSATSESEEPDSTAEGRPSLDELLARLEVPPPWLASVETSYDTSHPWKDARLEIRRLLGVGKPETHREALKLTWIYNQKGDISDGHELPMYTFMGGEPIWSIRAHQEYLAKPHDYMPIHAYMTLATLYADYGEFERAKAILDQAMAALPEPPWRIMRNADLEAAYGDLYVAWGKIEEAKESYAKAVALYPTAKPPYGHHLLPRQAARVQSKLDMLALESLATATLRNGQYRETALGYAGDIQLTVAIQDGRIADIQVEHEEKIDQNACVIIPRRIIEEQSLQVDAVTGATVTTDAIIDGVYRVLRQAGLE